MGTYTITYAGIAGLRPSLQGTLTTLSRVDKQCTRHYWYGEPFGAYIVNLWPFGPSALLHRAVLSAPYEVGAPLKGGAEESEALGRDVQSFTYTPLIFTDCPPSSLWKTSR